MMAAASAAIGCGVGSDSVSGPQPTGGVLNNRTYTRSVWAITDTGYTLMSHTRGATAHVISTSNVVGDTGITERLSATEQQRAVAELRNLVRQPTPLRQSSVTSSSPIAVGTAKRPAVMQRPAFAFPQTRVARRPEVGAPTDQWRLQMPAGGSLRTAPVLVTRNGNAVALSVMKFSTVAERRTPTRVTATALDSVGRPAFVIDVKLEQPSTMVSGLMRSVDNVGRRFLALVEPDALHAATLEEDDCETCWTDKLTMEAAAVVAAGAWVTAKSLEAGALVAANEARVAAVIAADALLACAETGLVPLCEAAAVAAAASATAAAAAAAAQAAAHGALLLFGAATVVAAEYTVSYNECMKRRERCLKTPPRDPIISIGGGGGGGGPSEDTNCYTITWEISYDGGQTWQWLSDEQVCTEYMT